MHCFIRQQVVFRIDVDEHIENFRAALPDVPPDLLCNPVPLRHTDTGRYQYMSIYQNAVSHTTGAEIMQPDQIGRASCRERV